MDIADSNTWGVITNYLLSPYSSPVLPYLTIIFAATTGASWSVKRKENLTKVGAVLYIIRLVCTALVLTIAATKVTVHYLPDLQEDWVIAPIALLIGVVGDDWVKAYDWMVSIVKRFANIFINKKLKD